LLYLQIPNKLNGQLYLPTVIKFRSLQDDLVSNERWRTVSANKSAPTFPFADCTH